MVTASQLVFANQLTDLVCVLPDLCQVARQTQALVTNESDKLHQPAIAQPRFKLHGEHANPLCALLARGSTPY